MEALISDWLSLVLRWTHVITAIAWIGSSFFFMWLDSHLEAPARAEQGVEGELWLTHSGGFYRMSKLQLTPDQMPRTLHWVKWEAAFTWISGLLLLGVVYYHGARVYLIDAAVAALPPAAAIAIGIATLAVAWKVYDLLWQSAVARTRSAIATVLSCGLLVGAAYALTHVFSGRGAFIHVGALLGTIMAANVWERIIPAQRAMVAATASGGNADPRLGASAKQRSVHNNYMTLPVVFIMLSNHYPGTYGHPYNWLILAALFAAGAVVRHWFNLRNAGRRAWWPWPLAAGVIVATAGLSAATLPGAGSAPGAAAVTFSEARAVITRRCVTCHSAQPSSAAFSSAPKGVKFDTADEIVALAPRIQALAVTSRTMPLGNLTHMTDAERALLGRWIAAGARPD